MIQKISIRDFCGKTRIYEFGPAVNKLLGPNEIGKSTVKHALGFGLFGTDAMGMKNPEHLISIGKDEAEVAIQTESATFFRKKKRGQPAVARLCVNGAQTIQLSQQDLTKALGMTFETFASSYDVGFFMTLPSDKKVDVLLQIAMLDQEAMFYKLCTETRPPYVKLLKPRVEAGYCADARRKIQNVMNAEKGTLDEVQKELGKATELPDTATTEQYDIEVVRARIELWNLYERELKDYGRAEEQYREDLKAYRKNEEQRERLNLELAALGFKPSVDEEAYAKKLTECLAKQTELTRELKSELPHPHVVDPLGKGTTCTRCGQTVSDKAAGSMIAEREAVINEYNTKAAAIAEHNNSVRAKIDEIEAEQTRLGAEREAKRLAATTWVAADERIRARIHEVSGIMPSAPEVPKKPDCYTVERKAQLHKDFEKILSDEGVKRYINEQRPQLLDREHKLLQSIGDKEMEIEVLTNLEKALNALPEFAAQEMLRTFAIPGYTSKLNDDGDFMVYDEFGCPYPSMSDGKKLKAGRELCMRFQSIMKKPPKFYFWDNTDLVDKLVVPPGVQVFLAEVDDSSTELKIIQYER